jgi:hypothetical protein
VAGARIDFRRESGGAAAVVSSAKDGSYLATLPVDTYLVTVENRVFYVDRSPRRAVVTAGATLVIDLVLDSGLR